MNAPRKLSDLALTVGLVASALLLVVASLAVPFAFLWMFVRVIRFAWTGE